MYAFDYQKASSLSDASAALLAHPEAKLLAGGMTLLPSMKHRLSAPSHLIDIADLSEMRSISVSAAAKNSPANLPLYLTVGAGMRHCEVTDSDTVKTTITALANLAGMIGDPQVRARGTLGGSVANNDPAADYPAAVLGLAALVVTDRREIAADDFFQGMFSTALESDEIIVAIRFAVPRRAAYAKFAQMATGYAMTGVMVADYGDTVRVAVTGAGSSVFRWKEAEIALTKEFSEQALHGLNCPADDLTADIHAPAEYRANLVSVMTRKAVKSLKDSV
jgi:aerobic carbon-monoxide dehydrogenase medium subunit